jgi:hypothetical protein
MSKGGGTTKSTSTVTQSNLPEYARPYFERLMDRGEAVSNTPYSAYSGERIAGFGGDMNDYFGGIRGLDPNLSAATATTQQATQAGMGASYDPTSFSVDQWGSSVADQYMNPYMEQVFDVARTRADQQFAQDQIARTSRQQRAGAFGGSRATVENILAQQAHDLNMQELEARSLTDAYDKAYSMFGQDRSAQFGADQASEQSGQFAAQFGQEAAKFGLEGAKQLAGMEELGFNLDSQQLGMLKEAGLLQQAQDQMGLDMGYQDFINQRDYENQQLNFFGGLLRGVPVSAQSNVVQYSPTPSAFSQLAGLGMGVYGLNQMNSTGSS